MKQIWIAAFLAACGNPVAAPASAPQASAPPSAELAHAEPRAFHVEVTGRGPAIVLIPGLASSGEVWTDTVAHLRARYTCHALTLAGFAGAPPIAAPLLATAKRQLVDYIATRRLGRPVIVGHSLGGALALELAANAPASVGAVVIVDMTPFLAGAILGVDTVDQAGPMLAQLRAARMTDEQYAELTRSGARTRSMVTSPAHLQQIIGWGLASDRTAVTAAMIELFEIDRRPQLPRITAPVLVLGTWIGYPGADRAKVAATFERQYAGVRDLRFAMSDTARHFIMFDDPEWWFAQLDGFLTDLPAR